MKRISKKHQNLAPEQMKSALQNDGTAKLFTAHQSPKRFDAKKFCGVLKFSEDAMVLQKRWRDEW